MRFHVTVKEPTVMDWWLLSPTKVAALEMTNVYSIWIEIARDALELRERRNTEFTANSPNPEQIFGNLMARSLWRNTAVASDARVHGLPVIKQPGDRSVESLGNEVIGILG